MKRISFAVLLLSMLAAVVSSGAKAQSRGHYLQPEIGYANNIQSNLFHLGVDYTYLFTPYIGLNGMAKYGVGSARNWTISGAEVYNHGLVEPTSTSGTYDPTAGSMANLFVVGAGVNFRPVQIWLPDSKHVAEVKAGLPFMLGIVSRYGINATDVMFGFYSSVGYTYRINEKFGVGARVGSIWPFGGRFWRYGSTFFLGLNGSIML